MDLLQLKYFQVVARLENVTRAAEELHIAQSSLSKTIARLEESVGVPLFNRRGRRIELNQFGEIFLNRVKRSFSELEQGQRELADLAGLESGSVAVGATTSELLPDLFSKYLTHHPHVKIRLLQVTRPLEIPERLMSGEFDLCVSSLPIDHSEIQCKPLMTEKFFLAVPPNHRLAGCKSIQLSEIANDSFISLTPESEFRAITNDFCQQAGFAPNIVFESSTPEVIRSLVKTGLGIAFIPAYWWSGSNIDGLAVQLNIENPNCQRTIWLSWVKDRYLSSATRNLSEFMINYFSPG